MKYIRRKFVSLLFSYFFPPFKLGVTFSKTTLTVLEGSGVSDTYSIVLDETPSIDVYILLDFESSRIAVSPGFIQFSTSNWNTPRTITVTPINNYVDDGDVDVFIQHSAIGDSNYAALVLPDTQVKVIDDDTG